MEWGRLEGHARRKDSLRGVLPHALPAGTPAYLEGRGRGAVRLSLLPKAAYLEGRCRGGVRLNLSPKAACLEGRCRRAVCLGFVPKED